MAEETENRQSFINASTLIPISLVITLLAASAGFGNFLGTFNEMKASNRELKQRIERLEESDKANYSLIYRLDVLEKEVHSLREKIK